MLRGFTLIGRGLGETVSGSPAFARRRALADGSAR
jgi:hypothetical protein